MASASKAAGSDVYSPNDKAFIVENKTFIDVKGNTLSKIELTDSESFTNLAITILTLGLYLAYQNYRLSKALESGNIQEAEQRVRNGANRTFTTKEIVHLAEVHPDSIPFLVSQITFSRDPANLSPQAENFLSARDSTNHSSAVLKRELSYADYPRTYVVQRWEQDVDFIFEDFSLPYPVRSFSNENQPRPENAIG